jgi:hypothetical protein
MKAIVLKILGAPSPNDFCHCGKRNRYDDEKSKRCDGRDLKNSGKESGTQLSLGPGGMEILMK